MTNLSWNLLNVNSGDMKNLPTTQMIFDRFRIRRKLSNGGYGAIWSSRKPNNNRSFMEFIKCECRRHEKSANNADDI
ncbi:hypothetical protein T4A_6609 [Trichinella pseudospiralis]|uniref:Uncharacterized protein n=1 Tax=Trichinella pseudospiralis TaxID=6337 RepID=A0A0V1EUP7_TRIPS|nr:hypothetical protein T4A_6609 [Trichinella pseudospiralis]